jgi:hypothetical protein
VGVGEDLHLDVSGPADEALDIEPTVAECLKGLVTGRGEAIPQVLGALNEDHAAPAAAGCRLEQDWEAHPRGNLGCLIDVGECIAADTWVDLAQWDANPDAPHWQRPLCLDDQRRFEAWVVREFGDDTMRSIPALVMSLKQGQHGLAVV